MSSCLKESSYVSTLRKRTFTYKVAIDGFDGIIDGIDTIDGEY